MKLRDLLFPMLLPLTAMSLGLYLFGPLIPPDSPPPSPRPVTTLEPRPDAPPIRGELLVASWYGPQHDGRKTASGEVFDQDGFTAAHRTLPFGTRLRVELNRRVVEVRINDRGPFRKGRDLDLSLGAARKLGMVGHGLAIVEVREVRP